MKGKSFLTTLIFIFLTFFGIEVSSLIITNQPISTSWRKVNKNGLLSNIENGKARHNFWGGIKQRYAFGEFGNRISLNYENNKEVYRKLSNENSCKYLILGDSSPFGWLIDYEKIYPTLIEKHLSKEFDNKLVFINSTSGGWGIADYHAYLDIYKNKLNKINLNGIIIIVNFDDARRAKNSNLYETKKVGDSIAIYRSNKFYYSKSGRIKRFFNQKFILPYYNFSQIHFNSARVIKNAFLNVGLPISLDSVQIKVLYEA